MNAVKELQELTARITAIAESDFSKDAQPLADWLKGEGRKKLDDLFSDIAGMLGSKSYPIKKEDEPCIEELLEGWTPKKALKHGVFLYEKGKESLILKVSDEKAATEEIAYMKRANELGIGPQVYGSVTCTGSGQPVTYFTQEYIDGSTLHDVFMMDLQYIRDALDLAYLLATKGGIDHHDLHDRNVMVDRKGRVYIIDYGNSQPINDLFFNVFDMVTFMVGSLTSYDEEEGEVELKLTTEEATNLFLSINQLVRNWFLELFPEKKEVIPRDFLGAKFFSRVDTKRSDVVAYLREGESTCLTTILGDNFINERYLQDDTLYSLLYQSDSNRRERVLKVSESKGPVGLASKLAGEAGIGPKVFNYGTCEDKQYIVMQSFHGITMDQRDFDLDFIEQGLILYLNLASKAGVLHNNLLASNLQYWSGYYLINYDYATIIDKKELHSPTFVTHFLDQAARLTRSFESVKHTGIPDTDFKEQLWTQANDIVKRLTLQAFGKEYALP
ncbi:Hypothetical protein POVN_LOCUS531 [uncultured virus]|nr:Hypothetical protein POVN_LOCUS531 [uncultured virus]